MRIALFARVPDVVAWLDGQLRELGHECVGVVTSEGPRGRYGDDPLSALIDVRPAHLDVLVASGARKTRSVFVSCGRSVCRRSNRQLMPKHDDLQFLELG